MAPVFVPLSSYHEIPFPEMKNRATGFREEMQQRRTVRQFSDRPVPYEIVEECLRAAASAPSGANLQPWHFVVVKDPETKHQIRLAAEQEEHEFYTRRATEEWKEALKPMGTDEQKPYLEIAPYLIVIFAQSYRLLPDGQRAKNYYTSESVGIATGVLITALHHAGLATLTHTPSPMGFLNKILNRPVNERPFLILVVGYPEKEAVVPSLNRKPFEDVVTVY